MLQCSGRVVEMEPDLRNSTNAMTTSEPVAYAASGLPGQGPSLVDMLHRIDELDVIPQLQVAQSCGTPTSGTEVRVEVVSNSSHPGYSGTQNQEEHPQTQASPNTIPNALPHTLLTASGTTMLSQALPHSHSQPLSHPDFHVHVPVTEGETQQQSNQPEESEKPFPRVGRPRTRPPRERHEWHYHLGGVRHCRVPLSPEHREVLEVAYVSRIMSKNFRKEGQPEKERIARITGMDIDKVQEWFKNRRKKDRLLQDRAMGRNLPKGHRSHKSTAPENSTTDHVHVAGETPAGLVVEIPPDGGRVGVVSEEMQLAMVSGSEGIENIDREIQHQGAENGRFMQLHIVQQP